MRGEMESRSWGQPAVVVVGIDRDPGLQAARILAARGVPVIGIAVDRNHFGCRTNVCKEILYATDYDEIVTLLESIGPSFVERAVLVPCSDPAVERISPSRASLERWYHVPLPSAEVVTMLMDKSRFYPYAEDNGFSIVPTRILRSRIDAVEAAQTLAFPCVLKPSFRTATWVEHTSAKAIKVTSSDELLDLYNQCGDWAEELIVQEWIEGDDSYLYSCNCYFDATSRPLVTFIARKLRQWPPGAGDSSLGEECRRDEVLETTVRLFESVGYHGLGYVEIKQDAQSGRYYIIEPNVGRPTGRSAIAEAGGVELLYTMYCDLVGWALPDARTQSYGGAKWIYLRKDLQSALWQWRNGDLTPGDWWRSLRGPKVYAIWSLRDPLPFLFDLWITTKKVMGRIRSRLTSPS